MIDQQEINRLAMYLEQGKLILYPTETIWGIGCDATNITAISRIDTLKKRGADKNYILLVDSLVRLKECVAYVPPKASKLIDYHQRPLTIIYERPQNLPQELLAPDGSIAIRVTKDPFCQALVASFGKPIVSTSANTSGAPYPGQYSDIEERILRGVDAVAEYRQEEGIRSQPSTIVKVIDGEELIFVRK